MIELAFIPMPGLPEVALFLVIAGVVAILVINKRANRKIVTRRKRPADRDSGQSPA